MAQRIKIKQCYDKTVEETEHNYNQLELSSGLLQDSVKNATNQLDETIDKTVGRDSDTIKPEDVLFKKDNCTSDVAEKQEQTSSFQERADVSEKAKRDSEVAERDCEISKEPDKRKASSENEKLINRTVDGLDEAEECQMSGSQMMMKWGKTIRMIEM